MAIEIIETLPSGNMVARITATELQRAIYKTFVNLYCYQNAEQVDAVQETAKAHNVTAEDVVDALDQVCFVDGTASVDWSKEVYALLPEEA